MHADRYRKLDLELFVVRAIVRAARQHHLSNIALERLDLAVKRIIAYHKALLPRK